MVSRFENVIYSAHDDHRQSHHISEPNIYGGFYFNNVPSTEKYIFESHD